MFRQALLFVLFGFLFQAQGFSQAPTSVAEESFALRDQVETMRDIYPAGVIAFEAAFTETFGAMGFTIDNPPTRELLMVAGWTDERLDVIRHQFGQLFFPPGMDFPGLLNPDPVDTVTVFVGGACAGDSIPNTTQQEAV